MKAIAKLGGALIATVSFVGAAFLLGMRRKNPTVLNAVRKLNRAVMNPQQMESAGTPGAYAAIIRHKGRKSGKAYETPVGVVATDTGFLITLPYGRQADWLKNVLAAGSAELVHEGETHMVSDPVVVPIAAVAGDLDEKDLKTAKLFGVDECLQLRRTPA